MSPSDLISCIVPGTGSLLFPLGCLSLFWLPNNYLVWGLKRKKFISLMVLEARKPKGRH